MKKILFFLLIFSASFQVKAGGVLYKLTSGAPTSWENPSEIVLAPDSGSCGDFSNAEMIAILEDVITNFSDPDEVKLGFSITENEIGDIDSDSFSDAFYGTTFDTSSGDYEDNIYTPYNTIIFDDTGEAFADDYGCENIGLYLGFARITHTNSSNQISRASFVMNCACFRDDHTDILCDGDVDPCDFADSNGDAFVFNEDVMRATIQHEMGHFLNLDHTPLYGEFLDDSSSTNDDDVPLMYPSLQNPERDILPKQDDIIALASMYPSDTFESSYCEMTGTILDSLSSDELQCAAILAINTDPSESISFITGSLAPAQDLNGDGDTVDFSSSSDRFESTAARGEFSLYLKPGLSYQIQIAAIDPTFVDNAGVNPCKNEQLASCTNAILEACNDDDEDTECEPCITNQVLVTSSDYTNLYRDECIGGESFDIGSLTAEDSVSYEAAIIANGGVVTGDDDDDTTTTATCQLQTGATPLASDKTHAAITLSFLLLILWRQKCQKKAS